uniref:G_PROTEIN_RECEP_F1_2 domain-containing protein n=1 Tax=Caenorhabditis tropicalis TaxID=1561998 RepID=A0A1I7T6F1_9PELO
MKIRFIASSTSKKSQEQLNMALLLQFILPFITIHIPFYIIVILPFFGIALRLLADKIIFLFCWCPAINPILVILLVKKIRNELLSCQTKKLSQTRTRSIAVVISM